MKKSKHCISEREKKLRPKVFSRLNITSELFIGHKLALEDFRKLAKDERKCLGIINKLKENSDIGQYGSYSKGFHPDLVYYWHIGGRKLTPTLKEINDFITKYFKDYGGYKSFKDIPSEITKNFRD